MFTATFSPEDSKLRLYASTRLDDETWKELKALGFKWAPKQNLIVAPGWTPAREDALLELVDEIEDEDYSPEERAADRAERFAGYRNKRTAEAVGHADKFEAGPSAFGHQNRSRAERQATRHDRSRTRAVTQWSKAEYWQSRTAAVISHALFKSSPEVRRGRILRLEAEQRKHLKTVERAVASWAQWQKVATLDGLDEKPVFTDDSRGYRTIDLRNAGPALVLAYRLANSGTGWAEYVHPRTGKQNSLYMHLTNEADPITAREAAVLWIGVKTHPSDENSLYSRWSRHYELRLTYERAMLAAEGGSASSVEMEPGGWLGRHQIQKVNKSPIDGRVVSVSVLGDKPYYRGEPVLRADGTYGAPIVPRTINVERFGESVYRAPTDAERAKFATDTKERKAGEKASKPAAPSLINPTDEDAQKLQDAWNAVVAAKFIKAGRNNAPVSEVWRMTQAEYSERSKGDYGPCEAVTVSELLEVVGKYNHGRHVPVFKVRKGSSGSMNAASRVVVLTDKPRKTLPWKAVESARATMPTEASVFPRLQELAQYIAAGWRDTSEAKKSLLADAAYIGWAYSSSASQAGFTEAGNAAYQRFREQASKSDLVHA